MQDGASRGSLHLGGDPDSSQRADSSLQARGRQHSDSESADLMQRLRQLEIIVATLSDNVDALEGECCAALHACRRGVAAR